jgi:hypothetical protein
VKAITTATAHVARRRVSGTALAAVIAAMLGLGLAGCGGSSNKGTSADPATIVPASAPVFAGAEVRPRGELKEDTMRTGQQLTHRPNPYTGLLGVLRTPGSPPLDYGRDVAPWLGRHAGAFVTSPGGAEALAGLLLSGAGQISSFPFVHGGPQGALVLDTSEPSAASKFLDTAAARAGAHQLNYRGVPYSASADGVAFAMVDRFAVIGSEAAVRQVIETSQGGPSLARSQSYSKLGRKAPQQALARLYVAAGQGSGGSGAGASSNAGGNGLGGGAAGQLLGMLAPSGASLTSVVPASGSLTVDLDALAGGESGGLFEAAPQGAQALTELPGESWLALGIGNAQSGRLRSDVRGLSKLLTGGAGGEGEAGGGALQTLVSSLLKPLQALAADTPQARADFASWMGPVSVFASGSSLFELRGAVVIDSVDAASSKAAVGKLSAVLRKQGASVQTASVPGTDAAAQVALTGLPIPLVIAAGHDAAGQPKFVLGLAQSSVALALNPPSTLAGSAREEAAAAALGEGIKPSLILEVPNLLTVLEGLGLTETGPLAGIAPYLRSATMLSGGARSLGGGVQRAKLVLGLAGSGG